MLDVAGGQRSRTSRTTNRKMKLPASGSHFKGKKHRFRAKGCHLAEVVQPSYQNKSIRSIAFKIISLEKSRRKMTSHGRPLAFVRFRVTNDTTGAEKKKKNY
ncbi:hypothetical protein F2P81_015406 [Scophthalmus maximus]|uniref:Uncharacterized protein n=1 Tax=Scophthalmus maximus TaxID=52904 RepID=A0A6A4SD95_SCOMX|nr:hypothetical protein F2P81_015406 [Scophthalmus maximus]